MVTSGALSNRPLRPLTVGGIFSAAGQLYQQNFLPLIAIVAIVQVVVAILSAIVRRLFLGASVNPTASNVVVAVLVGLLLGLFAFVAGFLQSGALTLAIADDYIGQPITVERAYSSAGNRLGALIGTSLLVGVLLFLMVIVVIGIPFAIYFGVRWAFIAQVVMLEGLSGTSAMRRSAQLVTGYWLRTLGILLLMIIAVAIVGAVLTAILDIALRGAFLNAVAALIVQILLAPFYSAIVTLLYFDLRVRKEGLDHPTLAGQMSGPAAPLGGIPGASTV